MWVYVFVPYVLSVMRGYRVVGLSGWCHMISVFILLCGICPPYVCLHLVILVVVMTHHRSVMGQQSNRLSEWTDSSVDGKGIWITTYELWSEWSSYKQGFWYTQTATATCSFHNKGGQTQLSDWITEARSCSGRSSAEWLSQDKVIQHRNELTHDNTIIHLEQSAQEIKGVWSSPRRTNPESWSRSYDFTHTRTVG